MLTVFDVITRRIQKFPNFAGVCPDALFIKSGKFSRVLHETLMSFLKKTLRSKAGPDAQAAEGLAKFQEKNYKEAAPLLMKAAKKNHTVAQVEKVMSGWT